MDCPWQPGQAVQIDAGLRLVLAPNPSPMTYWGTNTFVIGTGQVAVLDPGPAIPRHLEAILAALAPGERISHIIVTHSHMDHSPLARPLAQATGAPVLAYGAAGSGISARMAGLEGIGGGEGVDASFAPDACLADGDRLSGPDWHLEVLHTPGHMSSHICLAEGTRLFSGDHLMGWAPSLVSPPEGDMTDYLAALERLGRRPWSRAFPAHGLPIEDPATRIAELLAHRRMREAQILAVLNDGPMGIDDLLMKVYAETPTPLLPAARRNLLAHLIDLVHANRVAHSAPELTHGEFHNVASR